MVEQVAIVQSDQLVEIDDSTIRGDRSVVNTEMRPEDGLSPEKLLVNENREVVSSLDPGFRGVHMDIDVLDCRDNVTSNGDSGNALCRGVEKENKSDGLSRSEVNLMSTAINVQMGTDNRKVVESRSKLVYYGDIVANEQAGQDCKLEFGRNRQRRGFAETNSQSSCPKNLTLSGGSTGENTVENQCSASTEKV